MKRRPRLLTIPSENKTVEKDEGITKYCKSSVVKDFSFENGGALSIARDAHPTGKLARSWTVVAPWPD